jgi:hypothetical protein
MQGKFFSPFLSTEKAMKLPPTTSFVHILISTLRNLKNEKIHVYHVRMYVAPRLQIERW